MPRSLRFVKPARILACCSALALAWPALAQADTARFEIKAEPLSVALKAFAQQAHMQLLYEYVIVKDLRGNPVIGIIDKHTALKELLQNTGMEAVFTSNDAATITPIRTGFPVDGPKQPGTNSIRKDTQGKRRPSGNFPVTGRAVAQSGQQQSNQTAETLQAIVVTGSLIATSPDRESMSPVTFVNSQAFRQSGVTTVDDLLNQLPQVYTDESEHVHGNGTATVDLRDLGANRTLVLVDGQRLQPGDPGVGGEADLDMIPANLISGVQIQTGGASSIYGADAVAGVVNFKLRHDFTGVQLGVTGSIYQNDNGDTQGVRSVISGFNSKYNTHFNQAPSTIWPGVSTTVSFIAGVNTHNRKGNATFYATYRHANPAVGADYSTQACTLGAGYIGGSTGGQFTCLGSSNGYPGIFIFGKHVNGVDLANGQLVPYSIANDFNYGPYLRLQNSDERYTAGALQHYTFNPHVTAYSRTMFMDDHTFTEIAPSGAFTSSSYSLDCANPFLSSSELGTWCGGSTAGSISLRIGRRNVDGAPRLQNIDHTDFLEVIGAKGLIDDNWSYNGSFQYGVTNLVSRNDNYFSVSKINDALDVVTSPITGQPECAATAAGLNDGLAAGCVPWNIFGNGGSTYISPSAALNYLLVPATITGKVSQTVVNVLFRGDLSQYFRSPDAKGGLQVAVGADYRDVASSYSPDEEYQDGDLAGHGMTPPIAGDVLVREGYGEARLPIISGKPFAKALALDGSYRFSSYSPFNGSSIAGVSTNTYGVSMAWTPSNDYRFRASFQRAVRAPNAGELYTPQVIGYGGKVDPCAGPTPSASLTECERSGVTPAEYGNILPAPASEYGGLSGGNPDLHPETALTSSFGFGWTPSYIRGLSAQIDYYDIKIDNVIEAVSPNTIVAQCVSDDLLCDQVHRGSNGILWGNGYVFTALSNVGLLQEKGADVDIRYDIALRRYGRMEIGLQGTYVGAFYQQPIQGLTADRFDCAGY